MYHIVVTPKDRGYLIASTDWITDKDDAIRRADKCKPVWATQKQPVEIRVVDTTGATVHTVA
jgi:hypothetical protein